MKPYTKTPKSNADLATLIKSRGIIGDSDALIRILETVGYYRFTGYLHPFRIPNSEAYRSNTTLDTVWSIYMFDRHLRLMAMDALARIEIAIRAIITRCHTDFIGNPFAFVNPANMPKLSQTKHNGLLARISDSTHKASNDPKIGQKGSDPSVYALLYMPNFCSRQNLASLAQKPVALQRRPGLLRQCLCDVSLLHQRIQVRCRKPGLT